MNYSLSGSEGVWRFRYCRDGVECPLTCTDAGHVSTAPSAPTRLFTRTYVARNAEQQREVSVKSSSAVSRRSLCSASFSGECALAHSGAVNTL